MPTIGESMFITATEDERSALLHIESALKGNSPPRLIGPNGEEIVLPESVFHLLREVVFHMAHNHVVTLLPATKELTTQEAANMLNISRPYLVKLLESDAIPFTKVGTHRRILVTDVLSYKRQRDAKTRLGVAEITRISQEMGLYDD